MMTTLCHNHNQQRRVQVDFSWMMYNQRQSSKAVMDLQCHCRVYKQLKEKFLTSIQYTNYPIHDVEFSCFGDNGSVVLTNGPQIYNYIMPAVNFDYTPHQTLYLDVEIIEVSAGQKLAELDRLVTECKNTIKTDKAWRIFKDTAIAEEQLTLHELIEKQQKEIQALQTDMATLKRDNERRHRQEQTAFTQAEIHKNILCDECDDNVIGHRFKCTVCEDFDLCQKCEAKGLHSNHIMIRMVKPRFTRFGVDTIASRLLPPMEKKTSDIGTQKVSLTHINEFGSNYNYAPFHSKMFQCVPGSSQMPELRLPPSLCPVTSYVPEITINPPRNQNLPFEAKDFEMKLVASKQRSQGWRCPVFNSSVAKPTTTTVDSNGKTTKMDETAMSLEQVIDMVQKKEAKEDQDNIDYWRHFFAIKKNEELNIEDDKDGDSDETGSTCSSDSSDSSKTSDDSDSSSLSFDALSDDLNEIEESESSSESEGSGNETTTSDDFDVVEDEED